MQPPSEPTARAPVTRSRRGEPAPRCGLSARGRRSTQAIRADCRVEADATAPATPAGLSQRTSRSGPGWPPSAIALRDEDQPERSSDVPLLDVSGTLVDIADSLLSSRCPPVG